MWENFRITFLCRFVYILPKNSTHNHRYFFALFSQFILELSFAQPYQNQVAAESNQNLTGHIDGVDNIFSENFDCCFLRQINWRSTSIRGRTSSQIKTLRPYFSIFSIICGYIPAVVRICPKMIKESDF